LQESNSRPPNFLSAHNSGQMLECLDESSKIFKGCTGAETLRFCAGKKEASIRFPDGVTLVNRSLTHIDPSEWPSEKVVDGEPITLDDAFKGAMKEAIESASTDSSRYALNAVCLDVRDKNCHCVVGTEPAAVLRQLVLI